MRTACLCNSPTNNFGTFSLLPALVANQGYFLKGSDIFSVSLQPQVRKLHQQVRNTRQVTDKISNKTTADTPYTYLYANIDFVSSFLKKKKKKNKKNLGSCNVKLTSRLPPHIVFCPLSFQPANTHSEKYCHFEIITDKSLHQLLPLKYIEHSAKHGIFSD